MAADGHTEDGKGKSQHLPKTERESQGEVGLRVPGGWS